MSIGPFWVGDVPATALRIDVSRDGEPIELDAYTGASVTVRNQSGVVVEPEFTATLDTTTDEVVLTWPATTIFDTSGVYMLQIALTATDVWETLSPEYFVVEEFDGWHNLSSARDEWMTKGSYSDVQLFTLLSAAKVACLSYAPALAVDSPIPLRFRQAQLMQARNIANAAKTDPGESGDGELFIIRPYPLDNFIKDLLRPKRGVPVVG